MKIRHLRKFIFALFLFIGISGCSPKSNTSPPDTHIDSLADSLTKADGAFSVCYSNTFSRTQFWINHAQMEIDKGTSLAPSNDEEYYKYINRGMLFTTNQVDDYIMPAQYAVKVLQQAKPDFEYVYVHHKELPPSFRDDFDNLEQLLENNLNFINSLFPQDLKNLDEMDTAAGFLNKGNFNDWLDSSKKAQALSENIYLELKRLKN